MNRMTHAVMVVLFATPALVQGQSVADCRLQTQDACQKAEDIYTYLFPQLGAALAAGNPVLGSNRMLGGLGHFSVGVRASLLKASIPDFDNINPSILGRQNSNIPLLEQWTPVPVFDASVGLFKGFPVGVTHVGAIDALASLTVIPSLPEDVDVQIDGKTRFGFGAQVGLLEEAVVIPGISVSFLQRGLPEISFQTNANTPATFSVDKLDVTVSSWRVIASKTFIAFGLAAGFGGDTYNSEGTLGATAAGFSEEIPLDRSITRSNWFVDLTINLGPVKLAGEYGGVLKKTQETFNTFDPEAGASRTYFAAGLRIAF
jgi:hypothetical protein